MLVFILNVGETGADFNIFFVFNFFMYRSFKKLIFQVDVFQILTQ